MSFDSSGLPETVCAPDTTQLLEPNTRGGSESTSRAHEDLGAAGTNAPSATELSGAESRSPSLLCSSNLGRGTVGGRSRQEEFTYKSAVSSGPSLARIFSRVSAYL